MEKIFVVSKEVFNDYHDKKEINNFFNNLINNGNLLVIISRDEKYINEKREKNKHKNLRYATRNRFLNLLKEFKDSTSKFIVIGNRDQDFQMAVNYKILYLVPVWCKYVYEKSSQYGICVKNLEQLDQIVKTIKNQENWYYEEELPDGTKIYSLISGMTRSWDVTMEERELVSGFEDFLKRGNIDYYEILYYHFLAGISNKQEFRDINYWGIAPSSGVNLNANMLKFKDRARCMMKSQMSRKNDNLIYRHTAVDKSHTKDNKLREKIGAELHFASIHLSPNYDVRGKNICIFDDYLTHGNTFEAIRNLLRKAGANKIIFVSLGRFGRPYIYQDYEITGDVYTPSGFNYKLINREYIPYRCNNNARDEVRNLHEIFNL